MNRRTKIIVSVAGIFIVLLALLGLTYGYFLTRINGNSNEKSIDLATADLELTYSDDSNEIIGKDKTIEPGFTETKTFSVKNNGNDTSYVVVFENVENDFERKQDVVYTLTCESNCNGVGETVFPSTSTAIIVANKIKDGATQNYKLTIEYKEAGIDQSDDMKKKISAKINITNASSVNPYSDNNKTLAYHIINNAATRKNGTEFLSTPKTIPAQETSQTKYYNSEGKESTSLNIPVSSTYQEYYWTYGTGYEIDEDTGRFTLTGVNTCKYNDSDCPSKLKDNYIPSSSPSSSSSSTDKQVTTTNLSYVYKVTDAPASSGSSITMKAVSIISVLNSAESTLSIAEDDYGMSYYYRGEVKDNYLELNNMCFRIVRIQGDGSIKITLAKEGTCSSITDDNKKTAFINNASKVIYGYKEEDVGWDDEEDEPQINTIFNYEGYSDGLYTKLNNWYNSKLKTVENKLKRETWCLGGKTSKYDYYTGELIDRELVYGTDCYYYETGRRLVGYNSNNYNYEIDKRYATYRCSDEADISTSYIGALTADEVAYAGGTFINFQDIEDGANKTFYLYDNAEDSYWLLTYSYNDLVMSDEAFNVYSYGNMDDEGVGGYTSAVRPAVTIATGAELVSGDGTKGNPYKIK